MKKILIIPTLIASFFGFFLFGYAAYSFSSEMIKLSSNGIKRAKKLMLCICLMT